jgi:hypothetical protein
LQTIAKELPEAQKLLLSLNLKENLSIGDNLQQTQVQIIGRNYITAGLRNRDLFSIYT